MSENPIVETAAGRVEGTTADGVSRFLGIPFAAPPQGALRFAAPVPASAWEGVRDTTKPGPNAPQNTRAFPGLDLTPIIGTGWREGSDYLTVDVWTPDPSASGLPVMVFVHGGAFVAGEPGAPSYDGTALARAGVVLVSVTYRLGVEGFLPLPGGATNIGLRDQIAALEWVRDNVAAFGGDPDLVTVFGESAGAMSIGSLLGSPLARGLFRRAIVQSGGAEMVRSAEPSARYARVVTDALGVEFSADGVRGRSVADALAVQEMLADPLERGDLREPDGTDPGLGLGAFLPVLGDDVLPEHPLDALAAGSAADVDLLVGANAEEMNLYLVPTGAIDAMTADQVRTALAMVRPDSVALLASAGLDEPGAHAGQVFAAVMTELVFRGPVRRLADAHTGRTHVYDFAWRSPAFGGRLGACHGLELPFVFGTLGSATGPTGLLGEPPAPQAVSDLMRDAWVAFARTGDPGWPAFDSARRALRIDVDPGVVTLEAP
ncbi:carboxylesterase/lipase family protein [Pseudonocardia sp. T1-2H]|uniref:carboxylesterase/lipase family protein n=1 Tax=Pseudonocardia sp. T1-2H TaxID=3128899 RepID=UPI0031012424